MKCYNIETVEDQKVRTAFLKVGDVKIELLDLLLPKAQLPSSSKRTTVTVACIIWHLPLKTEWPVRLQKSKKKVIRLIDKAPRKGAEGLNIAFLHPKSTLGVLTELCEKPE